MIEVADQAVAPGHPTELVAPDQEPPERAAESASVGVGADQAGGAGEQPAQPDPAGGGPDQIAGDGGGDRAVPVEVGGGVVGAEERVGGHHDADFDGYLGSGADAGDPLDQGVGHHLAAGAVVSNRPGGLGGPRQRGEDRDPLSDRQQGVELRHGVRGWAQADPTLALGAAGSAYRGTGVELEGAPAYFADGLAVPPAAESVGDLGIDQGTIVALQQGGLAGDQGSPPLADPPVDHGRKRVREFCDQDPGQAQQPGALVRRDRARQGQLGAGAATLPIGGQPGGGVPLDHPGPQVGGERRLGGGGRVLQPLQSGELVDRLRLPGGLRAAHGDRGGPGMRAQPGHQRGQLGGAHRVQRGSGLLHDPTLGGTTDSLARAHLPSSEALFSRIRDGCARVARSGRVSVSPRSPPLPILPWLPGTSAAGRLSSVGRANHS